MFLSQACEWEQVGMRYPEERCRKQEVWMRVSCWLSTGLDITLHSEQGPWPLLGVRINTNHIFKFPGPQPHFKTVLGLRVPQNNVKNT